MPTTLTLIRHGETTWNADKRLQGHEDIPLNETGREQARLVAEALAHRQFTCVMSSDLNRAYATAQAIAPDMPIQRDERLREQHLGMLQGLTAQEAALHYNAVFNCYRSYDPNYIIPGGESRCQLQRRVESALYDWVNCHKGGDLLMVTHGGVLGAIFRHVVGVDLAMPRHFSIINAAINTISYDNGHWQLLSWADTNHLQPAGFIAL